MTMTIGRITGLPEPSQMTQTGQSQVEWELMVDEGHARQLLDLVDNPGERFVPIISTAKPELSGIYRLTGINATQDPNLDAAELRAVQVSASAENRGVQTANSSVLLRGDNRNWVDSVGVNIPLYVGHLTGDSGLSGPNAGPAGFTTSAVSTMRGSLVRVRDNTNPLAAVKRVYVGTGIVPSGNLAGAVAVNDRILVLTNGVTATALDGIYVVQSGTWTRATDADTTAKLANAAVYVTDGLNFVGINATTFRGTTWFLANAITTVGTTVQDWRIASSDASTPGFQSGALFTFRHSFGLRESRNGGPVVITHETKLADWYNGACTIDVDGELIVGNRLPDCDPTDVVIDNGLVKVGLGLVNTTASIEVQWAGGSPLAFGSVYDFTDLNLAGDVPAPVPQILVNTTDQVTLRLRMSGGAVTGSMDITINRGSRSVTVTLNYDRPATSIFSPVGTNAGTIGFEDPANTEGIAATKRALLYRTADGPDGYRYGISSAATLANDTAGALTTAAARLHTFAIHGVTATTTTLTGDDQLYGLHRRWFALMGQSTEVGSL